MVTVTRTNRSPKTKIKAFRTVKVGSQCLSSFFSKIETQSDHLSSKEENPVHNQELRDLVGGPWPRHLPYDDAREREKIQRGGLGCGRYFVEVRTDTRRS